MSTHYGRMIHEDDRTIMFANPEDAAEYIGFDLTPDVTLAAAGSAPDPAREGGHRVREGWREVLRRRQPHALLERRPGQLGAGRRAVRQGLDRVLPRLPGARAAGDALDDRALPEVLRGRPDEGRLRGRLRGRGDLPADLPEGVVQGGLQHHRAQRAHGREAPRASSRTTPAGTRGTATRAWRSSGRTSSATAPRAQALHRRVEQRLARLEAQRPGRVPLPGEPARNSASRTSTSTRARRSGRWTRTPSTCPTSTTRRPTSRT